MKRLNIARWGVFAGLLLTVFFIVLMRQVFYLFIAGAVLAYLLFPLVDHFEQRGMPEHLPILLSYAIFATVVGCLVFIITPQIYRESQNLAQSLPTYMESIVQTFQRVAENLGIFFQNNGLSVYSQQTANLLQEKILEMSERTMVYLFSLPQLLLYILLCPVIAYYLLRDHEKIGGRLLLIFPPEKRAEILVLGQNIDAALRGFIKGNLLVALIVGLIAGVGLFFLRVDYSLTLGAFVGLSNLIPYFGPFIGAIPVLLIALLTPGANLFLIALFLFFVQQIENIFISPKILGEQVGLHPIAIIFLVLAGGYAGGLFGMLFIVPIAAIGKIVIKYLYDKIVSFSID